MTKSLQIQPATMMVPSILLALGLFVASTSGGSFQGSKRDTATLASVVSLIRSTLDDSNKGIQAQKLSDAVDKVDADVTALIGDQTVDQADVFKMIGACGEGIDTVAAISALFDDPITFEGNSLSTALDLLQCLADKAEAAGDSDEVVALAAIKKTAGAIENILSNVSSMMSGGSEDNGRAKRGWKFNGSVTYNKGPYSATFDGSWNG